ncbi:hypothetical protein [Bacillus cereus]|uniref:Uncharacterized protein n=1 Tax=Bacillus cereus HuA3-9 TaxID=1053205 RepID=R8CIP7_BACCE|nr:hypothetical protein [Bacillus cereus]EOO11453.1 hypothetical protein IGA_05716 [Bacillus cereus HuA3-9]
MKYIKRDTGKSVHLHEELGIDMLQVTDTSLTFHEFSELASLIFVGILSKMHKLQCKAQMENNGSLYEDTFFKATGVEGGIFLRIGESVFNITTIDSMELLFNEHKQLVIKLYHFQNSVRSAVALKFIRLSPMHFKKPDSLDVQTDNRALDLSKSTNQPLRRIAREVQIDAIIKPQPKLDGSRRMPVMFRGYWATEPEQLKPNNFELDKDTCIAEALMQ